MAEKWTEEEIKVIKENIGLSITELSKLIPSRSSGAIVYKSYSIRRDMGLTRLKEWTEEEENFLRKLKQNKVPMREIAGEIGRPLNSVMMKVHLLGLGAKRKNNNHRWTEKETNTVLEGLINKETIETVAKRLNMTPRQVMNKALHLGFRYQDVQTEAKVKRGANNGDLHARNEVISKLRKEVSTLKLRLETAYKKIEKLKEGKQ